MFCFRWLQMCIYTNSTSLSQPSHSHSSYYLIYVFGFMLWNSFHLFSKTLSFVNNVFLFSTSTNSRFYSSNQQWIKVCWTHKNSTHSYCFSWSSLWDDCRFWKYEREWVWYYSRTWISRMDKVLWSSNRPSLLKSC